MATEKLRFGKEPKIYTGIDFTNRSGSPQKMVGQYLLGTKIWNAVTNEPGAVVVAYIRNANNRVEQREFFIPGSYFSPVINEWEVTKAKPVEKSIEVKPVPSVPLNPVPSQEGSLTTIFDSKMGDVKKSEGKPGFPTPSESTKPPTDSWGSTEVWETLNKTGKTIEQIASNPGATVAPKLPGGSGDNSDYVGYGLLGLLLWRLLK